MTIAIGAEIRIEPEDMPKIREFASIMVEKTNTLEPDTCIVYSFAEDFNEPGLVRIFEVWTSDEALAEHFKTQHMADFQKGMAGIRVKGVVANRYEIASYGPLQR
ncbi:MAG: putative quinol monooxygenase [Sphingomonadales bacterium]